MQAQDHQAVADVEAALEYWRSKPSLHATFPTEASVAAFAIESHWSNNQATRLEFRDEESFGAYVRSALRQREVARSRGRFVS